MNRNKFGENAFTGLEAAIVLIAFVVVAAVFSYVVLGAGFFTTQKSQETIYKGMEQASSNIQMVGSLYGIASASTTQIDIIQFNVGLAPGSPPIDLEKMIIGVSQPGTTAVTQLSYDSSTYSTTKYTAIDPSTNTALPELVGQKQASIKFQISPALSSTNKINIELRPIVGAALPFTRSAPSAIERIQVLM
jgi:archaeal flagellin FlaB